MKITEYYSHSVIDYVDYNDKLYFYAFNPRHTFQISTRVDHQSYDDVIFEIHELVYYFDSEDFFPLAYLYCKTNEKN